MVKAEYSKDSKEGVSKGFDYISKPDAKGRATATISHGAELAAGVGAEVKKEYKVNSNLKIAGDNTSEVTGAVATPIPTVSGIIKYEHNDKTGESNFQIGINSSVKAGAGIVLDATIIEFGIKIRIPK